MQEICTYGSVRGVPGNRHSYRDKGCRGDEGCHHAWETDLESSARMIHVPLGHPETMKRTEAGSNSSQRSV